MAKKLIKFILSPTGQFGLGYNEGEVAEIEEKQADELLNARYAIEVKPVKTSDKEAAAKTGKKAKPETATDKAALAAEKAGVANPDSFPVVGEENVTENL